MSIIIFDLSNRNVIMLNYSNSGCILHMKNLSSLINSGIDSMDSIFSSRELLVWMLRNYNREIYKVYNKYLYSKKRSNTFLDLFFNLIRKSCKIEKISVLEMPDERNNFTINYIFVKNVKADYKLLRD